MSKNEAPSQNIPPDIPEAAAAHLLSAGIRHPGLAQAITAYCAKFGAPAGWPDFARQTLLAVAGLHERCEGPATPEDVLPSLRIRWMVRCDRLAVRAIEGQCADPIDWQEIDLLNRKPTVLGAVVKTGDASSPQDLYLDARSAGAKVAGEMAFQHYKERLGLSWERDAFQLQNAGEQTRRVAEEDAAEAYERGHPFPQAKEGGGIVAWSLYALRSDAFDILAMRTDPAFRGKGATDSLLAHFLGKVTRTKRPVLRDRCAETREALRQGKLPDVS